MADVSVQIDIQTQAAKANLASLTAELAKVQQGIASLGKAGGATGGKALKASLDSEVQALKDFNAKVVQLKLENVNTLKGYTSTMREAVKSGAVGIESALKSMETAFKSDAIKRVIEDNNRAFKEQEKAAKSAAKTMADAAREREKAEVAAAKATQARVKEETKALNDLAKKQRELNYQRSDAGIVGSYQGAQAAVAQTKQANVIRQAGSNLGYQDTGTLIAAMGKDMSLAARMNTEMARLTKTADGTRGMFYEVSKALQLTEGPLSGVAYRVSLLGEIFNSTGVKMIAAVGVIAGFSVALGSLLSSANQMRAVEGFLKNVTDSTAEYETALSSLIDISKEQYTQLDSTAKFYGRLVNATKDLGISQNDLLKVTETLSAGFRLNMTGAGESAAAMMQFTQALGSGRLQGDEFRSMAENASVVMGKLAKAILGPSGTISGLRELASQGKLTTDIVVPAMAQINAEVVAAAAKMPPTIGQAFTKLGTAIDELAIKSSGLRGILDLAATGISTLADVLPTLANGFLALSAAAAALATPTALAGIVKLLSPMGSLLAGVASGLMAVRNSMLLATTATEGFGAAVAMTTTLLGPYKGIFTAITVAGAAYTALNIADSFRDQSDAIDNTTKALAEASGRYAELNATMGSSVGTLSSIGIATEDWANLTIAKIDAIMQKDKVFTDTFVANAKRRLSTEIVNYNAKIEVAQAASDNLKNIIQEDENSRRAATKLHGAPMLPDTEEIKNARAQLVKLNDELLEAKKQRESLQKNMDSLIPGVQPGATAGANVIKDRTSDVKELTAAFKAGGAAAKYATEQVQEFRKNNPKPVNEKDVQAIANYAEQEKQIYGAALQEYSVKQELSALEKEASERAKGRKAALDQTVVSQEKLNLYSSTYLEDLQNKVTEQRTLNELTAANGGNVEEATVQYEIQKAQNEYILDLKKKQLDVTSAKAVATKQEIADAVRKLEVEKKITEASKENQRRAVELADTLEKNISDGIYAGFTDGMDGFFESLKSNFLRGLADSIAASMRGSAASSIGSLFGVPNASGLGSSSSAAGSLGSLSDVMSLGKTLMSGSLLSGGVVDILNNAGAAIGFGSNAIQSQASQLFAANGITPTVGTGLGTQLSSMFNVGNIAGGIGGGYLAKSIFGSSQYGSIGSTIGGIAGSFIPVPILGSAIGSFLGGALGSVVGGGKPNPASVFGIGADGKVTYGSKHLDDSTAKSTYQAVATAFASLESLTGKNLLKDQTIMGGYDRGSAFFSLGDYKQAGVPIVKFDANDQESANAAVGKLAAMIAGQSADLSPELKNALNIIAKSSDNAVASLDAVAFALNFEKMGDPEEKISEVEQAMIDLNKRFDDAVTLAKNLELAESKVEDMRQKALATLREGFNTAAQSTITGIIDPRYSAVLAENERYAAQKKDAIAVGGNLGTVEMLHQLNLIQIEAQYTAKKQLDTLNEQLAIAEESKNLWEGLPDSLAQSIKDLSLSELSTLSPRQKVEEARRQYEALYAASRDLGNPEAAATAAGGLAQAGSTLLELAKAYYASSTDYASIYNEVVSGLGEAKTVAEQQFDIAKGSYDQLKSQTELLQAILDKGGTTAASYNANERLVSLRGVLSSSQFATAESIIASATPGVLAGGGRRTDYLNSNAAANEAAIATLRALGIPGFANGGGVAGTDSIPALLMPGERVLNRNQTSAYAANDRAQVTEMREMRKQMAQMQAFMGSLVELTMDANETRKRQAKMQKAVANG